MSTLAISGLVYLIFRSAMSFFASLAAGIFIDLDHFLDYYMERGLTLKIKRIYTWCARREFRFVLLFLHSIELVLILWIIISVFKLGIFWVALAIGLTQHIILDMLFNNKIMYPYSYLLTFRFIKGFRKEEVCRQV